MDRQVPIDSSARAEEAGEGSRREVAGDLAYQRLAIANVAYFGAAGAGDAYPPPREEREA